MATGIFSLRKVYIKQNQNIYNRNFVSWPESATYGYFGGGSTIPTRFSTIDRLDFSNETTSVPTSTLSSARSNLAATSNSSYGYFGGGLTFPPALYYSTINRLDFSNETVSTPTPKLSIARSGEFVDAYISEF